ncbi:MAG: class I SAM-dependent methyltransferase [Clostridia bacterium]|nr:MAG: class I SAM-dependent methyltransferase [Clostridia bacterium]
MGGRELKRERDPEMRVYTDLVRREIERVLPAIPAGAPVLDAGAGPGRYSLPLAARGYRVVHLDLSETMLQVGRRQAARAGIDGVEFVAGSVDNLSFADRSFALVLCLDAPISYVPDPRRAVAELARVARGRIILSVVSRSGQLPVGVRAEAWLGSHLRYSRRFWQTGCWEVPPALARAARWVPGLTGRLFPPVVAFTPGEISGLLSDTGCRVEKTMAPGSLARLVGRRALRRILRHPILREEFLALAAEFDCRPEILGLGALRASGLLVVAIPEREVIG